MMLLKAYLVFLCLFALGCSSLQTTSTSNFTVSGTKQIPKVVGVAFFNGEEPYATNARKYFYNALRQDAMFEKVYGTDDLREAMGWATKNFLTPEARRQLQVRLGVQGIFTANVIVSRHFAGGNSEIYMELTDIGSGNKLWSCHAQDDRIIAESSNMDDSATRAMRNAYKQLQKDLAPR